VIHPRNGFGFRGWGSLASEAASCWERLYTDRKRQNSVLIGTTARSSSALAALPLRPASLVWNFSDFLLSSSPTMEGIRESFDRISGVEYNFRVRPKKPVVRIPVIVEESHAPYFGGNHDLTGQRQGRGHFGNPCLHKTNLGS
jgi:hypothetical protein